MINIREESEKLLVPMIYGPNPSNPYLTEQEFATELRIKLEVSIFEAQAEARRQFILIDLGRAEMVEDMKPILERIINGT